MREVDVAFARPIVWMLLQPRRTVFRVCILRLDAVDTFFDSGHRPKGVLKLGVGHNKLGSKCTKSNDTGKPNSKRGSVRRISELCRYRHQHNGKPRNNEIQDEVQPALNHEQHVYGPLGIVYVGLAAALISSLPPERTYCHESFFRFRELRIDGRFEFDVENTELL